MAIRDARTNFSAGEVSDALRFRADLVSNRTGLRRCRNMIPRVQGGVRRRGGTQLVAVWPGAETLLPFDSGDGRPAMTVWTQQAVRFATEAGWVMDGAVPHELPSPYAVPPRQAAQSVNVMWLFHPERFMELRRPQGATLFQLVPAQIARGPFRNQNADKALTIQASGVDGTVTLTASAALFEPGHAGTVWRLDELDWSDTGQWVGNASVQQGDRIRFDGQVYEAVNTGTSSPNPPRHLQGEQADSNANNVTWRWLHAGYGIVSITAVTSPTEATATVLQRLPDQIVSTPTHRWREPAWSDVRGWPVAGTLYQNRLVAGGEAAEPYMLHFSAIQGFDDFEDGTLDDQAITRPLIEGKVSQILWLAPGYVLTVGTTGPEWVAKPATGARTVTPGSLETRSTTDEQSGPVPGLQVDDRLVFVDASRRRLVAHYYDFGTDAFTVDDLTVRSEHLFAGGITAMAWARRPDRVLWLLRGDGRLISLTWARKEQVAAYALHDLGGTVIDLAVMPSGDGTLDDLWLLVDRGGQRCVERMTTTHPHEPLADIAESWHLDGAVLVDGSDLVETVEGLGHLEGHRVSALIDGVESPPLTVTGGRVTLPWEGRRVLVGRPFTSLLRTLPFDLGQAGNSLHGRTQAIDELTVLMGPFVNGRVQVGDEGVPRQIAPRGAAADTLQPVLYEGSFRVDPSKRTDRSDALEIALTFDDAYPATVLGIVPSYEG